MRELAPVLVTAMMFMIPIVAILSKHQQKMAEIMRGDRQPIPNQLQAYESEFLRRELAELKSLMHQQAIAIDNLSNRLDAASLSQRLENVGR